MLPSKELLTKTASKQHYRAQLLLLLLLLLLLFLLLLFFLLFLLLLLGFPAHWQILLFSYVICEKEKYTDSVLL